MNKCKNCRWYVGHQFQGNCHRRAPIKDATSTSPFQNAAWPDLSGDCGCGDWEEIKMKESTLEFAEKQCAENRARMEKENE